MASTPFTLTNQTISKRFSTNASRPQQNPRHSSSLRISAGYTAAAERASPSNTASLYDVLGIQAGASSHEIKSAYRKLARVLHPDVVACRDDDVVSSGDEFMRVHAAYATLSDPEKRAVYDREVMFGRRTIITAADLTVNGYGYGYSSDLNNRVRRRTWETDQCW